MKTPFLIVLALMISCLAMAKQHKHKKAKAKDAKIESVTMQRTGCYGRCPSYILEIDKSGIATYTGIRFTEDSGVFGKKLSQDKINELFNQIIAGKIDTCQDRY